MAALVHGAAHWLNSAQGLGLGLHIHSFSGSWISPTLLPRVFDLCIHADDYGVQSFVK